MSRLIFFISIILMGTSAAPGMLRMITTHPRMVGSEAMSYRQTDTPATFCSVFEPCAPFIYPDSITSKMQVDDSKHGIVSRRGIWALAIVEYDADAVVESVNISPINASPKASLNQIDTMMLQYLQRYFNQSVVGSRVRRQALGFIGGRPESGSVDDGSMRRDSLAVGDDVLFRGVRQGTLVLAIAAGAAPHGGLGLRLVSMVTLDLRQ